MAAEQVLLAGGWRNACAKSTFHAENPATGEALPAEFHATGQVTVSFDLQNTGKRKGAEVAQLYVHQQKLNVVQPIKSLRGFQRVELEAGETKHISLDLPAWQLSYYDVVTKRFIVAPGMFDVMIGSSAEDTRLHTQLEVN